MGRTLAEKVWDAHVVRRGEDGAPDLRSVREGRRAAGRGWIGWTPRGAYLTADIRVASLLPAWLFLLLAGGLATLAWLREGRRSPARRTPPRGA